MADSTEMDLVTKRLNAVDRETQIWLAARWALRSWPMLGYGANSDDFDTLLLHASRGVLLCCAATNIDPKEANQFKQDTAYFSSVSSHSTTRQRFFKATEPADLVFAPDDAETLWFDHAMSASVFAGKVANVAGATQTKRAEEAVLHFSLSSVGFGHGYGHGYGHSYGGKTDELLDFEKPLTWGSLWDKMPPRVHGGYEKLIAHFGRNPKVWGFWLEWYEGILNGTPLPWDLSFQIATTLADEDWDAGASHVADRIRQIQRAFLAKSFPQAEVVDLNEAGKFHVQSVVQDPDQLIDQIFNQLDFSLEIALRGHNSSGFDELCVGYKYLDHSRKNCRDDPNAIHMHLRLAREIIENKFVSGEYRPEDGLDALVKAMERHEIQLRADHPVVRDAHQTFVEQRLRELDDAKRFALAHEFKELQSDSTERLSEEFGLDAETIEADSGVEAQANAVKRSGGRSQKMAMIVSEKIKKVDASSTWKASGIAMRLQKIADILTGLM